MTESEFDKRVQDRFLEVGYAISREEAEKYMNWAYGRAFFDGQGGWHMDYDVNKLDESLAIAIADRAMRTWTYEEEEC